MQNITLSKETEKRLSKEEYYTKEMLLNDIQDYIKALKYRELFGPNLDTHSGKYYNDIYNQHNIYSNFTDFFK